jgi:hypothetical protein
VLEQDVFEILHLIRSWRNMLAPVNQIPPEILALIPDFWDKHYEGRDQGVIALTHVCRAWRGVFTSRSSLWTDLDCEDKDKTRVYLERSRSLPVNLSLHTEDRQPPYPPFSEIIPHVLGQLRSLTIDVKRKHLQDITAHLSRPAPLLEKLSIAGGGYHEAHYNPMLTPALFNGDLSSLRKLSLRAVRTELPWRNMANLTSFMLRRTSPGEFTVKHLLDFFESTPHLRKVHLHSATPTSSAQDERLVSMACLETIEITGVGSVSILLDHLLIPVGARLTIEVDPPSPPTNNHALGFLGNLKNFPGFTTVDLCSPGDWRPHIQFSGPNGQVKMIPRISRVDETRLVLEFLDQFDTSRVEQLRIGRGDFPSTDPPHRALLPMKHLRTITLRHCGDSHVFIHALHPNMSSSGVVVCPELEELVIVRDGGVLDTSSVIGIVAARASKEAKLKSIRITGGKPVWTNVLERLERHVSHVECQHNPEFGGANDGSDDIYEDEDN